MTRTSARKPEHGAALVISLVLITIASIGAVTAMRSGHLQDRMASNQHNKVISQMAAEAGASKFAEWFLDNSDENLADAWDDTSLVFPNTAQLPPYGFFRIQSEPDWTTNPVVATVAGISRQGNETLAETRIRLEFSNTGSDLFEDADNILRRRSHPRPLLTMCASRHTMGPAS